MKKSPENKKPADQLLVLVSGLLKSDFPLAKLFGSHSHASRGHDNNSSTAYK